MLICRSHLSKKLGRCIWTAVAAAPGAGPSRVLASSPTAYRHIGAQRASRGGGGGENWYKYTTVAAAALVVAVAHDDTTDCHVAAGDYTDLAGVWRQDKASCESMDEFLQEGLGFPWFVSKLADSVQTTLKITFPKPGTCIIVDKTFFGRNETTVELGGPE